MILCFAWYWLGLVQNGLICAAGSWCWLLAGSLSGAISQGSWFYSMWVSICGQLVFFIAIKQHQFCHILLVKSNQRASSDLNGGKWVLLLMKKWQGYITRQNLRLEILLEPEIIWLIDYILIYLLMTCLFGLLFQFLEIFISQLCTKTSCITLSTLSTALNFKSGQSSLNSRSIM